MIRITELMNASRRKKSGFSKIWHCFTDITVEELLVPKADSTFQRLVDDRWSFRTANTKEFTHCYHTYPAMMIPQVARTLIEEYRPAAHRSVPIHDIMSERRE